MIFLGYDFYNDESAMDSVPVVATPITVIALNNSIVDEIYASENTTYDMSTIPQEWTFETSLHALFNNSLAGGNTNYTVNELSALRLKRREVGTYEWITLAEFPINSLEDLDITYTDRFVETNMEVEYMLVAVSNAVEGRFNSGTIESFFEGVVISEKDITYRAFFYDAIPTERNQITSVITTLKGRYPYVIRNGETNYTSGQIHAGFYPAVGCEINFDYIDATKHREELTDFLTNGKPKLLKLDDGRSFIVNIIDNIAHSSDGPMLYTDFSFVQTGDAWNTQDLYEAGLIEINL